MFAEQQDPTEHTTNLDISHADTCHAGRNVLVVHVLDKKVNVAGFDPTQGKVKDLHLMSGALAYDCPTGEVVTLMMHQVVHVPTMENDLLCPMQMRMNDVDIKECPKFLEEHLNNTSHTLQVKSDKGDELSILFGLHGVTFYFPTSKPTQLELAQCQRFNVTLEEPERDPSSTTFQEQEGATVDAHGTVHNTVDSNNRIFVSSVLKCRAQACDYDFCNSQCSTVLTDIGPNLHNNHLLRTLESNVKVSSTATGKRNGNIMAERLAKNWSVSVDSAKQTLKVTTQRGVRTAANPSMSRRFRTNNRQLRCCRLRCDMCADALDALDAKTVTSMQENKHAQIFATRFGWCRTFPLKASKSEAHEAVSTLFA
jgi:hypothetical protein